MRQRRHFDFRLTTDEIRYLRDREHIALKILVVTLDEFGNIFVMNKDSKIN